jgi:hypothetical protein
VKSNTNCSPLALIRALRRSSLPGRRAISGAIRESLAGSTLDRLFGPILIVDAKRDTVAIAEIKLGQIAVQVLLSAVPIDALHAALED